MSMVRPIDRACAAIASAARHWTKVGARLRDRPSLLWRQRPRAMPGLGAGRLGARRLAHDLQRRRASRPQLEAERSLRDEHLQAVERARAVLARGAQQLRRACAVDEVDDQSRYSPTCASREPELRPARSPAPAARPDRRAVDEQVGLLRRARPRARRARARAPRRARACGSRSSTSPAPASRSAHTAARALPPAPSTSARLPAERLADRRDQARRVGVLGGDRAVARRT